MNRVRSYVLMYVGIYKKELRRGIHICVYLLYIIYDGRSLAM